MPAWSAPVRVVTWNLWWRFGPQWRERQPLIARTLRQLDADVVALQEVWAVDGVTQAHEMGSRLGLHAAFAPTSLPPAPDPPENADQEDVEVGLGLLSRWPLRSVEAVRMPARHRPAPTTLAATLDHPGGPLHVLVACLEWELAHDDDRHAQARALTRLAHHPARDGDLPVLVAGDLNAAPGSPVLSPLVGTLVDAWARGGGDPAAVSLSSRHPYAPLEATELIDRRIDHVLVRPGRPGQAVEVDRAFVAGEAIDGLDPSDHLAVVCDVRWATRT